MLDDINDINDIIDIACPDASLERLIWSWVAKPIVRYTGKVLEARWHLDERMPAVDRAYNKVRDELLDVGLLYDPQDETEDGYLDQIRVEVAYLPSVLGEAGYVFEDCSFLSRLVGYEEGVIYLPSDLPATAYVPGGTLTDVIRHEYAHAWHWLEPSFFDTGWFHDAFGGGYEDADKTPFKMWLHGLDGSVTRLRKLKACRSEREQEAYLRRDFRNHFVSEYASTHFCEDFAETFMFFLRYRKSLERFKSRRGLYRKLRAVERSVRIARIELGL